MGKTGHAEMSTDSSQAVALNTAKALRQTLDEELKQSEDLETVDELSMSFNTPAKTAEPEMSNLDMLDDDEVMHQYT